jgi:hypothetical protein
MGLAGICLNETRTWFSRSISILLAPAGRWYNGAATVLLAVEPWMTHRHVFLFDFAA